MTLLTVDDIVFGAAITPIVLVVAAFASIAGLAIHATACGAMVAVASAGLLDKWVEKLLQRAKPSFERKMLRLASILIIITAACAV